MTGVAVEYRDSFGHKRWLPLFADSFQKSEQLRPLLQPGDVRALPPHEQLVFVTGYPPVRARKIRYYADRAFNHRVVAAPDHTVAVDTPRRRDSDPLYGVPHDWLGERAKGIRVPTDEIFDPIDDEEWMLPGTVEPLPGAPVAGPNREDPYGL
jgi:type IV secretion system protein VirD4